MAFDERESEDKDNGKEVKLDWKDYVAFIIALFQTSLLPIILIIGILMLYVFVILIGKNIL